MGIRQKTLDRESKQMVRLKRKETRGLGMPGASSPRRGKVSPLENQIIRESSVRIMVLSKVMAKILDSLA